MNKQIKSIFFTYISVKLAVGKIQWLYTEWSDRFGQISDWSFLLL